MYGTPYTSRCIAPVASAPPPPADDDDATSSQSPSSSSSSSFLVGTTALREENEIHLIAVPGEDAGEIVCRATYPHKDEVWDLAPCPAHASTFFTVHNAAQSAGTFEATLWRAPETGVDGALEPLFSTAGRHPGVRHVAWSPGASDASVVMASRDRIALWNLSEGRGEGTVAASTAAGDVANVNAIAWSAADPGLLCAASGGALALIDARDMSRKALAIPDAHEMAARSCDFSRTDGTLLASGGDDCCLCVWDLRRPDGKSPLVRAPAHSHWVWQAKFNPFHDALIATASSDSLVRLWNTMPDDNDDDGEGGDGSGAPPIASKLTPETYDEHEDSVYGVAWSLADPWTFLSLSYDGRVMRNTVQSTIKYKILLP